MHCPRDLWGILSEVQDLAVKEPVILWNILIYSLRISYLCTLYFDHIHSQLFIPPSMQIQPNGTARMPLGNGVHVVGMRSRASLNEAFCYGVQLPPLFRDIVSY